MKTKNVSLAIFAFVFAIGTAFASFLAPEDVFVHAKLKSDPDGPTVCVNTGVQCDNTGTAICTVTVPITGGTATASTGGTFRPYRATCQVQLNATQDSAGGSSSVQTIDRILQ
jgi:hypothetical protein